MPLLGSQLTLLIGPTLPLPAPVTLTEALKSIEVTHQDQGRSGFQLTFEAGRAGPADIVDYPLLLGPLLRPWNRVVLVLTLTGVPEVLMDGVITHQQHTPSSDPGASTITVTGEDLSVLMDLKQKRQPWPAVPEMAIALAIVGSYAQLGMLPEIIPATSTDVPLPIQRTPVQVGTDLAYLQEMAGRFAYVFYVEPGPAPMLNTAYWGPPKRVGIPQSALSVNLGNRTNVDSIGFSYNALEPNTVAFKIQDRDTESQFGFETFASTRLPLSALPALPTNQPNVRSVDMGIVENPTGLNIMQTITRAQALTDASTDNVVSASGTLDGLRYGGMLKPRGLVGLRGAGFSYDGNYYVKSVSHSITKGNYKQRFTITRDGVISLTPAVLP
ncbi:MAG TPA: hypothetical protein VGM91_23230 [Conexibacter sp.]|jgi:hypothetical protein